MDNEIHYQLTSDINQHVRLFIGSLEIPNAQSPTNEPDSIKHLRDTNVRLYVTVGLLEDGRPMRAVSQRSKLSKTGRDPRIGADHHASLHAPHSTIHEWGEWLILPVRYSSLPRSARISMTIWTLDELPVGCTSIHAFHESGVLRTGVQKLIVYNGGGERNSDERPVPLDGYVTDKDQDVRFNTGD